MDFKSNQFKKTIVGVIVVVLLGAVAFNNFVGFDKLTEATTATASSKTGLLASLANHSTPTSDVELPPEPVNGAVKAVVELGASGFNSFIVEVDKLGNYKVKSKKFGASLAIEGMTSTDEVKAQLRTYIGDFLNKGVSNRNIHFVVSSGAAKEPKTKVIADGLRALHYVVNEVTADQEGKYAFKATMNPLYEDKGFVVDVGSGNTKISWYENGTIRTQEASGAKYFQKNLTDEQVFKELRNATRNIPADKRQICFVIGGVPNSLAKQHGSDSDRYIVLRSLDSYVAGDDKKLSSGLNILKAVQSETSTSNFVFDNDSNFTIGFLISIK